jgi:acetyltransferase-like isoleucine patch superfamily enzyme
MSIFIHETADVSPNAVIGCNTKIWNHAQIREDVVIGENCVIGKNVYIDPGVTVGSNVKIQNNVSIYKGVTIEDNVFLGPSMTFTNDLRPRARNTDWQITKTLVKNGASIGANATIVCGVTIGENAMAGAGSVVTRDVARHALVVGNPARKIGNVCACGERTEGDAVFCGKC